MNALLLFFLIGGHQAPSNMYLSTVKIDGNCTAAKVASHTLLLAAHCVFNNETLWVDDEFTSGKKIRLMTHYGVDRQVTIESSVPHDSYGLESTRLQDKGEDNRDAGLRSFDVAIISIKEDTPEIPLAEIRFEKPAINSKVVISGWGCTESVHKTRNYKSELKINENIIMEMDDFNFVTGGKKINEKFASLCPGDSGGPLYSVLDGSIIGVNSYYKFLFYDKDIPSKNTHTRLDKVKDWLILNIKRSEAIRR